MFSALFFGAACFVAGVVGYRLDGRIPMYSEARWSSTPIVWEIALGAALLLLGLYFMRRLPRPFATTAHRRSREVKRVGSGKSPGAVKNNRTNAFHV